MVHPKPKDDSQAAMFAWLIGKDCDNSLLPDRVQTFDKAKKKIGKTFLIFPIPPEWDIRSTLARHRQERKLASNLSLASFQRHKVFEDAALTELQLPVDYKTLGQLKKPRQCLISY